MGQYVLAEPTEGSEFVLIPEDTRVHTRITKVEEKPHPFFKDDDGNPQDRVYFTFEIQDDEVPGPDGEPISMFFEKKDGGVARRRLWYDTSTNFTAHEGCRLYVLTLAALGVDELKPGFAFNPVDLEGNPVDIIVGIESWDDKNKVDENGLPLKRSKNSVKQPLRSDVSVSRSSFQRDFDEEPFRVDAGDWTPGLFGSYPTRLLG